jgi:hypothetical protein
MASVIISGDTSGSVTITAPAVAGTPTLTLPTTTDTLVGKATTDTLTNKTLTSPTISTINLTGGQIAFPATQSASSDANTLDDYEEGTFTATMSTSSSGSVTIDTSFRTGWYTKIGRQVTIIGQFKVSSVSSPAGELYLNGLPFTSLSASTNHSAVSLICDSFTASATTQMVGYIAPNGTSVAIGRFAAGAYLGQGASTSQAGSYFFIQATYFTA